jgi:hypothetical protein
MVDWSETARFPAKLDREGIIARVGELRDWARSQQLSELDKVLELPADVSARELGARILSALALVTGKPEYAVITKQLEILTLNLKHLK